MTLPRFSVFPVERRQSSRQAQNQIVRLKFDDDSPWLRGMLNNVSQGGACVSVSTARVLPAEFTLVFPPNEPRRCRLVWRSGERVGVEFLPAYPLS
jgi:PilZ domain